MKHSKLLLFFWGLSCCCLFLVIYFFFPANKSKTIGNHTILSENDSVVKVFLFANYSDYFVYHGVTLGFQYELLKIMADSLDLDMEIDVECDYYNIINESHREQYDILAVDLPQSDFFHSFAEMSEPFDTTYSVLLARRSSNVETDSSVTVYLPANFAAEVSSDSLSAFADFKLARSSYLTTEELFELIDNERIDYAATDYHTAKLLLLFYPQLEIKGVIGAPYPHRWILNSRNNNLNSRINKWLKDFIVSKKYTSLCRKYFSQNPRVQPVPHTKRKNRHISPYDNIAKKYASAVGLDWRFVVSVMFQESKFFSGLYGLGGSFGLMQMMPVTCEKYGIDENSTEEEQIEAGVRHIKSISRFFSDVADVHERLRFVAAAYNAGPGHIQDAQRLAAKYGDNPLIWDDVAKYLILKADKEYFTDAVVRCGYYPGKNAVAYSEQVMLRFDSYKLLFR